MAMSARERNLLILVGVLAVGALAWFLFFGPGGGGDDEEAAPTPVTPPSPAPTAEPAPPGGPGRRPPRTFAFFGGRDPFVPLVVAEAGAAGTGTAEAPTEPADGEAPTDGAPSDGFQPTNGDQNGGAPVAMGGRDVQLVDVFTRNGEPVVQVSVDGEAFVVGEGERFAGNFEVSNIEGTCATFLFGDESFTLCEGEVPK
jgi:hypothetical protein